MSIGAASPCPVALSCSLLPANSLILTNVESVLVHLLTLFLGADKGVRSGDLVVPVSKDLGLSSRDLMMRGCSCIACVLHLSSLPPPALVRSHVSPLRQFQAHKSFSCTNIASFHSLCVAEQQSSRQSTSRMISATPRRISCDNRVCPKDMKSKQSGLVSRAQL